MDITSFLGIIVFCFLLFMEGETKIGALRIKTGLTLGDLLEKLEVLQDHILSLCSILDDFYDELKKHKTTVLAMSNSSIPRN